LRPGGLKPSTPFRTSLTFLVLLAGCFVAVTPSFAHISEQGFILLLPTDMYINFGVAAVGLTVAVLAILPAKKSLGLFVHKTLELAQRPAVAVVTSLASLAFLALLVFIGFQGPRDPLGNLLPLVIWTVWWVGFVIVQGLFGDFWHWLNPWTGFYRLVQDALGTGKKFTLPSWLGAWPGVVTLMAFFGFALADLAPDDPDRLAVFVGGYWLYTFCGMLLFGGEVWLSRCECFTVLLRHFSSLALFQRCQAGLQFGTPGWPLIAAPALTISGGVFVLLILGSGTFDGINETFWWLGLIGVNPLEFPGRSAVVWPTLIGLAVTNILLVAAFAGTLYVGLWLIGERATFVEAFGRMVRSILPIALGYHAAHYLAVLLVSGQYTIAAFSDPWARGADWLGLGDFRVTTGFFNTQNTVEMIWLTQAGFIVAGHMLAVLVSHAIAVDMFRDGKKATVSQIPMAIFMVLYTLIGLTLLAAPRGA